MTQVTSTSGSTNQVSGLSFLNDLQNLLHGKGGVQKIAPALDIIEQLAMMAASLFPPTAAIATGIEEAATLGEVVSQSLVPQPAAS